MRTTSRLVGLGLGMVISIAVGSASAQDAQTQRDRQGPVTVTVTLATPASSGSPVTVQVLLDTHSVALEGVAFDRGVTLRKRDGSELAPIAVKEVGSAGHHRQAEVEFRSIEGGAQVRIVVRDIGGISERVFAWDVPAPR